MSARGQRVKSGKHQGAGLGGSRQVIDVKGRARYTCTTTGACKIMCKRVRHEDMHAHAHL